MEEIKNFLIQAEERIVIPWNRYINMAQWCNEVLTKDGFVYLIRKCNEKDNVYKNSSYDYLTSLSKIESEKLSTDSFYFPAYFTDKSGNAIIYNNDFALSDLQKILSPDFMLPSDLFDKDMAVIFYVLALKKAFYEMSLNNPPIKTALYLADILMEICKRVAMFHTQVDGEEKIRTQNSSNKKAGFIRTLKLIEKSHRYKDIEELVGKIKPYMPKNEIDPIHSKIDRMLSEIIKNRSPKTLYRYRTAVLNTCFHYYIDKIDIASNRNIYGLEIKEEILKRYYVRT